jgi:hypothetical protein
MNRKTIIGLLSAFSLVAGCSDYLTGGELSTDPNRPTAATSQQLFVGIQAATWALLASDPPRLAGLWTQQFEGGNIQYEAAYDYDISEQTTNGFHQSLYLGGGLVDIRKLEEQALAAGDSIFLGQAQVMEALVMGTGASMFGDLTYSHALKNELNPPLDDQLDILDSVQVVLDAAIVNLSRTGPTNAGAGDADLAYGGDPEQWTKLAHTLKARYLMQTAELDPSVYAEVLAEANQGLQTLDDNFNAVFSGNSSEQNFWYQFAVVQRPGYLLPNPQFVNLLRTRNDPRLHGYFHEDLPNNPGTFDNLADSLIAPNHTQPLVTAQENLLLAAEAAQRTGANGTALTLLNEERAIWGLGSLSGLTGQALLSEILTEEYIALFQSLEVWNLYKRTCTPNLTPTNPSAAVTGGKVPARFPYDAAERNTNENIPTLSQQPKRNDNDPANATSDGTGAACLGQ